MKRKYRLGVFDRPVVKDWAFWHAMAWAISLGISTAVEPLEDSSGPWIDVPGVAAVAFFFVGWATAAVRRLLRELNSWLKNSRSRSKPALSPNSSTPMPDLAPGPHASAPPTPPVTPASRPRYSAEPSATPTVSLQQPLVHHEPPFMPTPAPVADPSPVPMSRYSGAEFREAESLTSARQHMPYPVARAARALQTSQDPLEQYQYLLDLGEHLTLTLGMLAASWLRANVPEDPALRTLHTAYHLRGVSQGHWHEVTKAAEREMARSDYGLPGFVEGVRDMRGQSGSVQALQVILAERNRAAHGARPHNRSEAAVRNTDLAPHITTAVERASFLTETPWVLVEAVSFRRQDRRWNVRFRRAMGDHPDFDAVNEISDHPLANDTFYVLSQPEPLDLTPMLVLRYCEQCRSPEVCHADRVDERAGVSLKSFARGHQVFDPSLIAEVESLVPGSAREGSSGA